MLLEKYQVKDGTGLVKYRELVNSLDTVFSDACNPTDVIQNARTTAVLNDEEKEKMIEMMTELNRHVVSNRILLKPGFMDFDRSAQ